MIPPLSIQRKRATQQKAESSLGWCKVLGGAQAQLTRKQIIRQAAWAAVDRLHDARS